MRYLLFRDTTPCNSVIISRRFETTAEMFKRNATSEAFSYCEPLAVYYFTTTYQDRRKNNRNYNKMATKPNPQNSLHYTKTNSEIKKKR